MLHRGRPYSAASTTATFGSRCTPQMKDYKMNPKVTMYQTDGFGRDTYIKEPNGGFRKSWANHYHQSYPFRMTMTEFLKNTHITSKFPIYRTNGLGRDSYIYKSCGGFYHEYNYPSNYKVFFSSLRNYRYDPYVNEPLMKSTNDYQRYAKLYQTPVQAKNNIQNRQYQRALSARLARPKHQRIKIVKK